LPLIAPLICLPLPLISALFHMTCLLEMIASLEVELWASGELEDSREDEKRVSWTRVSTILCSSMTH
jgi:hypothetical protein